MLTKIMLNANSTGKIKGIILASLDVGCNM